jgi:hypothetical protein
VKIEQFPSRPRRAAFPVHKERLASALAAARATVKASMMAEAAVAAAKAADAAKAAETALEKAHAELAAAKAAGKAARAAEAALLAMDRPVTFRNSGMRSSTGASSRHRRPGEARLSSALEAAASE